MFGLGKKSRQLVGLDIGSSSIKAVELKSTKAGYELVSFGMEALAPDTVVDGAIMDAPQVANAISKIFDAQRVKTKNVATSVSGHSVIRSEEHTSELQSPCNLVCRLLLEKKKLPRPRLTR